MSKYSTYTNVKSIEHLPLEDLKSIVKNEIRKANRNLKNLKEFTKTGEHYSPSLKSLDNLETFKIGRRGKLDDRAYRQKLLSKYRESKYFNDLETSTIRGTKRFEAKTLKQFEKRFGAKIDVSNKGNFWKLYDNFKNDSNNKGKGFTSTQIQDSIAKQFNKLNKMKYTASINKNIEREAQKIYEQEKERNKPLQNASAFFD